MSKSSIVKQFIKQVLPPVVISALTRLRTDQIQRQYSTLDLEATFDRIYAAKAWGDGANENLSSGSGSTGRYVEEYCALLRPLLIANNVHSLTDLGCGDFNTAKELVEMTERYIGVDITQAVVQANTRLYANASIRFVHADLTKDRLPAADAGIVRQVLQHLSNPEIHLVLENIRDTYPIAFITEHLYVGRASKPNLDITHGPGTRVPRHSGVFIDQPPFNVPVTLVGDVPYATDEVLRTWLVGGNLTESPAAQRPAQGEPIRG